MRRASRSRSSSSPGGPASSCGGSRATATTASSTASRRSTGRPPTRCRSTPSVTPEAAKTIYAVLVLAHESYHTSGVADEAAAELLRDPGDGLDGDPAGSGGRRGGAARPGDGGARAGAGRRRTATPSVTRAAARSPSGDSLRSRPSTDRAAAWPRWHRRWWAGRRRSARPRSSGQTHLDKPNEQRRHHGHATIHERIEKLVSEEHELWQREAAGNADEATRHGSPGQGVPRPDLGPAPAARGAPRGPSDPTSPSSATRRRRELPSVGSRTEAEPVQFAELSSVALRPPAWNSSRETAARTAA